MHFGIYQAGSGIRDSLPAALAGSAGAQIRVFACQCDAPGIVAAAENGAIGGGDLSNYTFLVNSVLNKAVLL